MPSTASRSSLIDYTYQHIDAILSGQRDGTRPEQLQKILEKRIGNLTKLSEPFGKASDASKKKVESGKVELPDGVTVDTNEVDKEVVSAISERFSIDQVDALILLRSFLYNEGLPPIPDSGSTSSLVEELLTKITPFYFSERLHVPRVVMGLLRCNQNADDPFHDVAETTLSKIISDPNTFAQNLVSEYQRKSKLPIPAYASRDPRLASQWAKQNAKEQLNILELLYSSLWDYVACNAPIVISVYEAAYSGKFGYEQENSIHMLDEEGQQVQRDLSAIWLLLTVEVLNLELISNPGLELSANPDDTGVLASSPKSLGKIHNLVMSHSTAGYSCTMLAWALYLKGICDAASRMAERPQPYVPFLKEIRASAEVVHRKGEKELHSQLVSSVLSTDSGLFAVLLELLTQSPFFSVAIAARTGSAVSEPNSVSYRAVIKGLLIALLDYEPVELIPDFEGLVEVWIALFGKSESSRVVGICRQYWDFDWRQEKSRRAIVDVARSRFPVQFRPLIRILRSMSAAGFLAASDLDSLAGNLATENDRQICASYAFHYFLKLPTYTQVIPASLKSGVNALYDRVMDRVPGSSTGTAYTNLRPVTLPGGSVLPQKSLGRLLSSDSSSEPVVVAWQHEHSGWKLLVDVLLDFVGRRLGSSRTPTSRLESMLSRRDISPVLLLDDIGMERDTDEEEVIADSLEFVLSIIRGNPPLTRHLLNSLEEGGSPVSFVSKDSSPPDLVQLIFMILEDALPQTHNRRRSVSSPLIAPALGVLSALLAIPIYSNRVWLFFRSSTTFFGSDRDPQFTSSVLASERATGRYVMTIALLKLVRDLFDEAVASLLSTQSEQPRLQAIKEEVLLRALKFVHGQIWVEYSGWRYAKLGEKYEIGREISALYSQIIETMSAVSTAHTFTSLSEFMTGIMLHDATSATIGPIVNCIASGKSILDTLVKMRRFSEAQQFAALLEKTLLLTRLVLNLKQVSDVSNRLTLLEQTLCSDMSISNSLLRSRNVRVNCVDTLAWYIKERELGPRIPLGAMKALTALCTSLSECQPAAPSIIGLFSDPVATMRSLMKIVSHPYDDLALRNSIWTFMSIAVEKQQALAVLIISGQLTVPIDKGKGKAKATEDSEDSHPGSSSKAMSAVEAASNILTGWQALWDSNPQLLASVVGFMDVVWTHGLEHAIALKTSNEDGDLWKNIVNIAKRDVGVAPDFATAAEVDTEEGHHSVLHDEVLGHAYRLKVKGHVLRILGSELARKSTIPPVFSELKALLTKKDETLEAISQAASNSYDPALYDSLVEHMKMLPGSISVESLKSVEPLHEREFGDNFALSIPLLHSIINSSLEGGGQSAADAEALKFLTYSVNLNLSLAHTQRMLADAWCTFLENAKGYLKDGSSTSNTRTVYLAAASSISRAIVDERRTGDYMCAIHDCRLRLIIAALEVAWFSSQETADQTECFMHLLEDLDRIVTSETFPPGMSFLGVSTTPFHRPLLQVVYFCARNCRNLVLQARMMKADHRIIMGRAVTSALLMVIDALRLVFDTARTRIDVDLDKDVELLVAVFQQCTRPGLNTSSVSWLTRCQETDVISASLGLFAQSDISGFSDLDLLRSRGQPLYAPHVLLFHMALASIPFTAERMASEGLVTAYCNNSISQAISDGAIEAVLPELPNERSPVHKAYCHMLTNVTGVMNSLASPQPFIEGHVVGFVQLYGKQISRTLSWTNDDPLTLPLLEELKLTVELFYLLAETSSSKTNAALASLLRTFTEHGLPLLQQLNYALTHPKHLTGLLEPVTPEERIRIDRETTNMTVNVLNDLMDSSKKPLLANIILRLFVITGTLVSTLSVLGGADTVLISDPEEWPLREAIVVPHSKVTVGEPASIGTLLELGTCAFETLQFLNQTPSAPTTNRTGATASEAREMEDRKKSICTVRQTLECVLTYAATQLAMSLINHEGEQAGDMEMEETENAQYGLKAGETAGASRDRDRERRMKRKSLSLADRLRRGMTGELTMDLQTLVNKAVPVVTKSADIQGTADFVDITKILKKFLEERIIPS